MFSIKLIELFDYLTIGKCIIRFAWGNHLIFAARLLKLAGIHRTQSKTSFVGFYATPLL